MTTSKTWQFRSPLAALALAACALALPAQAARSPQAGRAPSASLTFHADNEGKASRVVLTDSLGVEVASVLEAGRGPAVETATGIPMLSTRLLARLRDAAAESDSPGAPAAVEWVMHLMGDAAVNDVGDIPANGTTKVTGIVITNWCGLQLQDVRCPSNCTPSDNPKTCGSCGCTGTSIVESPAPGNGPPLQRTP